GNRSSHKPFLLDGFVSQTHSGEKRLFQLRHLAWLLLRYWRCMPPSQAHCTLPFPTNSFLRSRPMNRRKFLTHTVAAGAALSPAPTILNATDKAGSKNAIIGAGEHRYECIHNWGELPDSIKWQTTHNVAVDEAGQVYITHMGQGKDVMDTVVVFDPKGKFVR